MIYVKRNTLFWAIFQIFFFNNYYRYNFWKCLATVVPAEYIIHSGKPAVDSYACIKVKNYLLT